MHDKQAATLTVASGRTAYLDWVEAADDPSVLDVDVRRRVSVATLGVRPPASLPRPLATHLQRQPTRVLPRRRTDSAPGSAPGEDQGRRRRSLGYATARCRLPGRRRDFRWRHHRDRRRHFLLPVVRQTSITFTTKWMSKWVSKSARKLNNICKNVGKIIKTF